MARVVPIVARTIIERNRTYRQGAPVEIASEDEYFHLMRSGRFRNPDQGLRPIRSTKMIPTLPMGASVTLVREVGLGDVLMVLVVIRALKDRFPRLNFSLATGRDYLPIVQGLPFLHSAEALIDIRGVRSNVIDLRNVVERDLERERTDRIEIFARHCGVTVKDFTLAVTPTTKDELRKARALVGPGRVIALAVRGSTHVRTWPIDRVLAFAELAVARGYTVAVLDGARFEMPDVRGVANLTGALTLAETRAVIAVSDICVSPDSGLQHLAEAVGTRCLAIYSTTPPKLRIGHYRHVKAIWREKLPCVPCMDRGCALAPCMLIAPEVVMRAVENWERLGMWTDADSGCEELAPVIDVTGEGEIMESWLACGHCR